MLCIGHRGAMGHEPENTLLSIEKALSLGVDWIEVDVYNIENNLVVIHDRRLERTTNGSGYIEQRSFSYLRSLDAGKGQQIPTLSEVLALVNRRVKVNIELKGFNTADLVVRLIHQYIQQGWKEGDFLISSFNHYELERVRQQFPQIELGLLIYGLPLNYLQIARQLKAIAIILSLDFVTKELIVTAHQNGFKAFVYTVNEPNDIEQMRALQVDGIFTNYPERV
jgi:glycerophosphoryl diester phosphodiesterase